MDSGKKSPSLPFPPEKEVSSYITSIVVGLYKVHASSGNDEDHKVLK
jgi:hypothetical protein